ncbi:MAG: molybdenum cofactor guanylyltransferase [Nitrososphaerota archaeon]|nr:molybdenum cofactor guanylyltransferase [Nitrososphaerota archaeon]
MGRDKSLLTYRGVPFLTLISEEMSKISDDVVVVIGAKDRRGYQGLVRSGVRVESDAFDVRTPLAGIATGLELAKHPYAAVVGCDTPLVRRSLLRRLFERARDHSAAVPVWRDIGRFEPLVSVYRRSEVAAAAREAIGRGRLGCMQVISSLQDVVYVDVEELRGLDVELQSFLNINSEAEYDSLLRRGGGATG